MIPDDSRYRKLLLFPLALFFLVLASGLCSPFDFLVLLFGCREKRIKINGWERRKFEFSILCFVAIQVSQLVALGTVGRIEFLTFFFFKIMFVFNLLQLRKIQMSLIWE